MGIIKLIPADRLAEGIYILQFSAGNSLPFKNLWHTK